MAELVVLWAAVVGAAGRDELGRAISDLSAALDDAISCDEDSLALELLCGTPDVITVAATSFQRDGARRRAPPQHAQHGRQPPPLLVAAAPKMNCQASCSVKKLRQGPPEGVCPQSRAYHPWFALTALPV